MGKTTKKKTKRAAQNLKKTGLSGRQTAAKTLGNGSVTLMRKQARSRQFIESIKKTNQAITTQKAVKKFGKAFGDLDLLKQSLSSDANRIKPLNSRINENKTSVKRHNEQRALKEVAQIKQDPIFKSDPTMAILAHLRNKYES